VNGSLSERAEREQAAYDDGYVFEASAKLHARFDHVFLGPNSTAAEAYFADRIARWTVSADVLDYGCYTGELEDTLARFDPRSIAGIDISRNAIDEARCKRACLADYQVMDATAMTFSDESFDLVVGRAILHHLDFESALREIYRVLRPGGRALFVEPLRGNPVGKIVRVLTTSARTEDETPLSRGQIRLGDALFGSGEHFFANLLSVPAGVMSSVVARKPDNAGMRAADRIDRLLAQTPLRYWMRVAVLAWQKRG
jgi:SAM-dependent methyltransferase